MELMPELWAPLIEKVRATISHFGIVSGTAISVLKDEEGIKWSVVLNGCLTAGVIAAGTSIFTMQQNFIELRTRFDVRAAYVDKIQTIDERQQRVIDDIAQLRGENVAATGDRFRGVDAQRMEDRIQRQIDALEKRISVIEQGRRR